VSDYDYRDVLRKASELVAEEGRWVQDAWFQIGDQPMTREDAVRLDKAGALVRVCALGAVTLTGERLGVPERVIKGARSRLAWFVGVFRDHWSVSSWNDSEDTSQFEVANLLREAADYEGRNK
jgi:hypothetical protein